MTLRLLLIPLLLYPGVLRAQDDPTVFSVVTGDAGIVFEHENGASPEKYMPETMGSGGLIFDADNDGWADILLINGGSFVDRQVAAEAAHRLYRNDQNGTFTDVTSESGIGISGYGMGACAADYDNDGWIDLYLTSYGANTLYRNTGAGVFSDVTARAGVGFALWSTSCAFGDVDNDGDVDLYVANYVDFAPDNNKYCGDVEGLRLYCHPNVYNGVPDILYRNNGDGTFTDVTEEAGVYTEEGKGLGVVIADYDDDGWVDIYVANDSVPNFLFHNLGEGVFEESGLLAGVAVGANGQPLAGMGTDAADIDGDGRLDFVVTNLDRQTHNLYRNLGEGFFSDATYESGLGEASLPFVGFGTVFFDYDNDADLDLAIANGDVLDNASLVRAGASYEQTNLLLRNDGQGRFEDVSSTSGPAFSEKKVSRALAVGDLDNDGDLDVLVTNNGQTPDLLRNEGGNRRHAVEIRLVGTRSNRSGVGARLRLALGERVLARTVKAGTSYLGQNDLRIHFGLGEATRVERLEIAWPSGTVDVLEDLPADRTLVVEEGGGVTASVPFEAGTGVD